MLPQEIKHSKITSEAKNILDKEDSFSFFNFIYLFEKKILGVSNGYKIA